MCSASYSSTLVAMSVPHYLLFVIFSLFFKLSWSLAAQRHIVTGINLFFAIPQREGKSVATMAEEKKKRLSEKRKRKKIPGYFIFFEKRGRKWRLQLKLFEANHTVMQTCNLLHCLKMQRGKHAVKRHAVTGKMVINRNMTMLNVFFFLYFERQMSPCALSSVPPALPVKPLKNVWRAWSWPHWNQATNNHSA